MKKGSIIIISIVAILGIILLWGISTYNNIVSLSENVDTEYSNVSVALERRADLIPNLVKTVKGYAQHEEKVITQITEARQKLLNANNMEEKAKANDELTSALNALMVVVENYPDLKANTNFINLQDELAGTENRIATARRDYNSAVKTYNTTIKKVPTNIIASIGNFDKKAYFEVSKEKSEVPNVEF